MLFLMCLTYFIVLQMCHKHGVMHRDLKRENFMFANMKETSPLKAIDFGLSVFFKPGIFFSSAATFDQLFFEFHQFTSSFHMHKLTWLFLQARYLLRLLEVLTTWLQRC